LINQELHFISEGNRAWQEENCEISCGIRKRNPQFFPQQDVRKTQTIVLPGMQRPVAAQDCR
jgi:hypothetical protein